MPRTFLTALGRDLGRIYVATVFFAIHYVLTIYINSSFLSATVGEHFVGILYATGSLLGVTLLFIAPSIVRKYGNKNTMIVLIVLEFLSLISLAFIRDPLVIIAVFIAHHAIIPTLFFHFDVFIKHYSKHKEAGAARGTYLSIINIMFVIVPLISGLILSSTDYASVYSISALITLPFLVAIVSIKHFKDSKYAESRFIDGVRAAFHRPNIRNIVLVHFILQMFFASMVVYMPIHLRDLGFDWKDIGIIFTIMLTPFVLFEYPLGKLSDIWLGEKELLIAGFIIMSLSTALIPFVPVASLGLWAALLFMTRVGASCVEIMAESYFFKKINNTEADLLSLWRSMSGIAYIVIPLLASVVLIYMPLSSIFFIIALITTTGIVFAARLKDTL